MDMSHQTDLKISNDQLWSMAQVVERALDRAIQSLIEFDISLARTVIDNDKIINSFEIDIDNSTYNFLAFNTEKLPSDTLRLILSTQKINPMLERIGDHAVNIAESAETLSILTGGKGCTLFEVKAMADHCKNILHDALKCFFEKDQLLAEDVLTRDETVDNLNMTITAQIKSSALNGGDGLSFETAIEIIRVCKNLERIADLGSNIAEEAEFSILGRVVKHHLYTGKYDLSGITDNSLKK